jgi:threonine synthase
MWRYRELLPLDDEPRVSTDVGWTPLVEAPRLARALGVGRVWIKNDGFSFPTLSFKDRVVAVAINKAVELGITVVAAPSTGNLANAVASHAARAGLVAWVIIPEDLELGKVVGSAVYAPHLVRVRGTYDDANRLAREAAATLGWGVVNVNLRPYYGEGSKTMAFEIAEQLGWRLPTAVVAPMAGGSLITKLRKGFEELRALGWVSGAPPRMFGVQAAGCAPIARAVLDGSPEITPVQPRTVSRSIAIGDPVDGPWALETIRRSGGWAAAVDDDAMREGIHLLAREEGIFTETAGGVTVSGARQLAAASRLSTSDEAVLCMTGNGLKTIEALGDALEAPLIDPTLEALTKLAA